MVRLGKWQLDLPEYFVARYFHEFVKWAQTVPTLEFEPTRFITFLEGDFAERSPDPEQGKKLYGAWLFAKTGAHFVECEPYREQDRDKIRKHCARMQLFGVRARDRLVEPPRPGIPGLSPQRMNGE
jgi:hypothetical protein